MSCCDLPVNTTFFTFTLTWAERVGHQCGRLSGNATNCILNIKMGISWLRQQLMFGERCSRSSRSLRILTLKKKFRCFTSDPVGFVRYRSPSGILLRWFTSGYPWWSLVIICMTKGMWIPLVIMLLGVNACETFLGRGPRAALEDAGSWCLASSAV